MDAHRASRTLELRGLLVCSLVIATVASLIAGLPGLAAILGLATLGLAAASAGADTRAPGNWTSSPPV